MRGRKRRGFTDAHRAIDQRPCWRDGRRGGAAGEGADRHPGSRIARREQRGRNGAGHRLSRRPLDLQGEARQRFDRQGHRRKPHAPDRTADRIERARLAELARRGRRGADAMSVGARKHASLGGWLLLLIPALWLAAFFLIPFLIVLKISLSQTAIAQPPYLPVFDPSAGWQGVKDFLGALSFENYASLVSDSLYVTSYGRS